jgi:5-oxoprolinase (ATP-hydrolysing)
MSGSWQFWIDVGGTFTDCIGVTSDGKLRQFKTLSSGVTKGSIPQGSDYSFADPLRISDPAEFWTGATCRLLSRNGETIHNTTVTVFDNVTGTLQLKDIPDRDEIASYELDLNLPAPVLAIRWLLGLSPADECPPVRVRFGTTRGTNALLTRRGARTALITTRGFGDVPLIGNQDRPDLFDLNIRKPEPLFSQVFEVDERIAADGSVLLHYDRDREQQRLIEAGIVPKNFDSIAICFMNAYRNPVHEKSFESLVRDLGFSEISRSSEVSPLIRFVPRCDTTVLDAYLNPVLRQYMEEIRGHLPGSEVQVMTSAGGLVDSRSFRGRDCILSGPAGGIVGFAKVATAEGFRMSIGFDMGGTSTDVARFDGVFEFENETTKAGVRIMSPVLAIETVAAGGGSVCGFDGTRLFVGPQSAGADPGPACYGAGGPLTVTDLNVFLGRVLPQHFPFPLNTDAVTQRLSSLQSDMLAAGLTIEGSLQQLAEGLLQIANDNMVQAIRKVSVSKGYHPADYALVSFGGAGGQHACSIARSLGIGTVLVHPFAGILSAYGIGQADVKAIRQASVLKPLNEHTLAAIEQLHIKLAAETAQEVLDQGIRSERLAPATVSLEMRYAGTDSALTIDESAAGTFREAFEAEHERLFGYRRVNKDIEVASLRVETIGTAERTHTVHSPEHKSVASQQNESAQIWFRGRIHSAQVISRESLVSEAQIPGPAIICEPTSTVFVEPGCQAIISSNGTIRIAVDMVVGTPSDKQVAASQPVDPVLLEVCNNQFVAIAEQMGETLRRTSTSTNVRERLDFSCALFDSDGALVVNAPHVPVHLGAMGETVLAIMQDHPEMCPGDVFVTNDPYRGGSHLPDVTVITPVFVSGDGHPDFFVANRAHHAEIGGIVPGSMPPFSKTLAEEGVLITSRKLVDAGVSCEGELRQLLKSGPYPSRAVSDNLADMAAQAAANESGARRLRTLAEQHSAAMVQAYMQHIQSAAAKKMRQCLQRMEDKVYTFQDELDDGTRIAVSITVAGDQATVDFTGTAGVHTGNMNANRAITTAAVLYSFRCLLNQNVPLNAGVLEPLDIIIPEGLLNPTSGSTPAESPAIVGGNVETSQRIVDVLLGALGLAAASQGTMNNLTFGNETFGYYETICGGAGATATAAGTDAVHTHMTNTRLTDPEVLEQRYPVRLQQFAIRKDSGGAGQLNGGNGIVREIKFLKPLHVSMLSQRRESHRPYGIAGGEAGQAGRNSIDGVDQECGSFAVQAKPGTVLKIETPGGGGFGKSGRDSAAVVRL